MSSEKMDFYEKETVTKKLYVYVSVQFSKRRQDGDGPGRPYSEQDHMITLLPCSYTPLI